MNGTRPTNYDLAEKYRPLLVLYPEISKDSRRHKHYISKWRENNLPHIDQDYHPRGIGLVLDQVWLPGKKQKPTREEILRAMSENKFSGKKLDYIRVTEYGVKECDKYWELYAKHAHEKIGGTDSTEGQEAYPRKAYAHVVRGEGSYQGYLSIQYWLPYFYDDWANVHQMDWEMVSVILTTSEEGEVPYACVYNAHHGGQRNYWMNVDKVDDEKKRCSNGLHPVVYVANGSHAAYFSDSPRVKPTIPSAVSGGLQELLKKTKIVEDLLTDHVPSFEKRDEHEEEHRHFPEIEVIPEPDKWVGEWRWLNFTGNWGAEPKTNPITRGVKFVWHLVKVWGNKKGGHLPVEQAGPKGPATKGKCWENPFKWINEDCYGPEEFLPIST